jgi:hypothetical protein
MLKSHKQNKRSHKTGNSPLTSINNLTPKYHEQLLCSQSRSSSRRYPRQKHRVAFRRNIASTDKDIPFMPDGWAASAGGFPAMTGNVPFLMKDLVLFAASFYLLKQDVARVSSQNAGQTCQQVCEGGLTRPDGNP